MTESRVIIKHLARENDPSLLPQDVAAWRRADTLDGVITDVWKALGTVCYFPTVRESLIVRLIKRPKIRYNFTFNYFKFQPSTQHVYDNFVPNKLEQVSKFIGKNDWCLGNKVLH